MTSIKSRPKAIKPLLFTNKANSNIIQKRKFNSPLIGRNPFATLKLSSQIMVTHFPFAPKYTLEKLTSIGTNEDSFSIEESYIVEQELSVHSCPSRISSADNSFKDDEVPSRPSNPMIYDDLWCSEDSISTNVNYELDKDLKGDLEVKSRSMNSI